MGGTWFEGEQCPDFDCCSEGRLRYSNEIDDPFLYYHRPGAGIPMADDLTLAGEAGCRMVSYDLNVIGTPGEPPFTVWVDLRTDPCDIQTVIPGSEREFPDRSSNGSSQLLIAIFDPPISIPNSLWMSVEFSSGEAGWVRGEEAEVGSTDCDEYYKDDPNTGCNPHFFPGLCAGFWASTWCECCQVDDDCDDGDPCTVNQCNDGSCVSTPVVCPDPDQCNTASCDPGGLPGNCDIITPRPNGTECPDGVFCNGDETCVDGECVPGSDPCPNQCCDETDHCVDVTITPGTDCGDTSSTKVTGVRAALDFRETPIPGGLFKKLQSGLDFKSFDKRIFLAGSDGRDFALKWNRLDALTPCADTGGTSHLEIRRPGPPDDPGPTPVYWMSSRPFSVCPIVGNCVEFKADPVVLSLVPPTPEMEGMLTATSEHPNGGTFTASFSMHLLFTIKRADDIGDTVVLDTGALAWDPWEVQTVGPVHWVGGLSGGVQAQPCAMDFIPGVWEDPSTGEQCCERILMAGPGIHLEFFAPDCAPFCEVGACCLPPDEPERCNDTLDATACEDAGGCFQVEWPNCDDTDGDGLSDWHETFEGAGKADNYCEPPGKTDDCQEPHVCHTGTDPFDPDTDADGCLDGEEAADCSDPLDVCSYNANCVVVVEDCNANDVEDVCDIRAGTSEDCQDEGEEGYGQPDECESGACCLSALNDTVLCFMYGKEQCEGFGGEWLGPCADCDWLQDATVVHEQGGLTVYHSVGQEAQCPGEARATRSERECPDEPYDRFDPWVSRPDGGPTAICQDFGTGDPCSPPIPAGFFGEGSDSFTGLVCLQGEPLGSTPFGEFGDADTIIRRPADPFDRCDVPSPAEVTVDAEVVALNLKTIEPITVYYDGSNPEEWDVAVDLSAVAPDPTGWIMAFKTHCNGGTYTNSLNVQARFTFTKVEDPGEQKVLDTGLDGICPVTLGTSDPQPWVSDIDENTGMVGDPCSDFHAGIEERFPVTDCDCNNNGIRDMCDIENCSPGDLSCQDCNSNGVPDECDVPDSAGCGTGLCTTDCAQDCNENCIPDECEPDCNGNGVPDDCDIASGTSEDVCVYSGVGNGISDECELDCNDNDIVDNCEIEHTPALDFDGDGILNECVAPFIPADEPQPPCPECSNVDCSSCATCEDGQVEICELASYACRWRSGCNADGAGAIMAATIWTSTECYCTAADYWESASCPPPTSLRCETRGRRGEAENGSATRSADSGGATARMLFMPGTEQRESRRAEVRITTKAPEEALVMGLEYQIPMGWKVTAISHGGAWDHRHRKVKWGPFFENLSRTVSLTVTWPADKLKTDGLTGAVTDGFAGVVWFDGVGYRITVDLRR